MVTFAKGGGSLSDLTTEQYQKLLDDSGMDDFTLKATVTTNNPKANAQFSAVGDKLIGYYINPKTGEFETFESKSIPGLAGNTKYTTKATNNGLLLIPDNIDPNKPLEDQIKRYDAGVDYTEKTSSESGFSLSPGERRYDAQGNLIAEGGEKPVGDKKIVKIDGVDYVDNGDGTYSKPVVPDTVPSADKIAKANEVIKDIDGLLANPNLSKAIGPKSSLIPEALRSGERNAVDAIIDSLVDKIAIENLGVLKGPMSDKDIVFIRNATAGLKKNVDEASFKAKLAEIKQKFEEIRARAEQGGGTTGKTREQLKQEFPQASEAEIEALYKEELGKTNDLGTSGNYPKTDVSNIRNGARVTTAFGSGIATGIQAGSPLWAEGLDLVLEGGGGWGYGAPVKAPFNGTVVAAKKNGGFGNQVRIKLDNGEEIWVSHLAEMNVKPGQKIAAGTLIGKQGNTGSVLGSDGRKLTPKEIAEGRGTHLDITMVKPNGKYYTSKEVASLLGTRIKA